MTREIMEFRMSTAIFPVVSELHLLVPNKVVGAGYSIQAKCFIIAIEVSHNEDGTCESKVFTVFRRGDQIEPGWKAYGAIHNTQEAFFLYEKEKS